MSEMPWSKFFWSDWEADQGLRLCSLAAQGLWMRMLCVCARHEPKGYLSINGNPLGIDAIARLAGVAESEAEILMRELDQNGVFSRNRTGCIYSRRMVRDEKKSQEGRKHKKRGIAQATENKAENSGPSRVPIRGASPQIPDTRIQKESPLPPKGASFADFWASWPNKTAKAQAEKAWKKLSPADREAASSAAVAWFSDWRRKHPDASPIHPASYLNQRRWEDERASQPKAVDRFEVAAINIRSGKPFLCSNISASLARELISRGMVTETQCKEARVI